jgi:hypothetical protein
MQNLTQIYIPLSGEAVDVWRPVDAIREGADLYRIVSPNPDPEEECWPFRSGDIVRCESHTFAGGEVGLVAYAKS